MKTLSRIAIILAAFAAVSGVHAGESGWTMRKEAQITVPANPGGGSDISARMIADIVAKNNLADKNLVVVNRPGGACAVGYNYVGSKAGDPYTLLSLHSGNLIVSYVNDWDSKYDDLTDIIAIMAWDDVTLCVREDSEFKDIKALLDYARANPGTVRFGSDQRGNSSQLGYELIKKFAGVDMNYVQYDSSGDVAGALLGGHVDLGILNPGECVGQVAAGKFVPIVTFAPERIEGDLFKNAPTFAEVGYPEITFREYRGLSGAKNMPPAALKYYEDMCRKIVETEQWKETYLKANSLTPAFMDSKEATAFAKNNINQVMDTFRAVGYFDALKAGK